jgi:hypothetical protein
VLAGNYPDLRVAIAVSAALVVLAMGPSVSTQALLTPTPAPQVTADDEPWFQAREPILFAGNIYYPAGATVYFNRNEMTRTGFLGGVPLYARTTLEPFSVIYVPVAGGLMQPYERRRSGELAGTVGSTVPSFPLESPARAALTTDPGIPQAPGPPTGAATSGARAVGSTLGVAEPPAPVATTGTTSRVTNRLVTAAKPEGLNGIFVVFEGQRWFSSGPAVTLNLTQFSRVGDLGGSAVYRQASRPDTLYVVVAASAASLVAPYTRRDTRR